MISKLFKCLGYTKTSEVNSLKSTITELEKVIKGNEEYMEKLIDSVTEHKRELKNSRTMLHQHRKMYKDEIEVLENQVKGRDNVISELKKEVKNLKRKNSRLLTKQSNLKEQITTLEKENIKHKAMYTFWKAYSEKVVDKLEYLCFGSVLPNVVRALDLEKYSSVRDSINYEWYTSKDSIGIKVHE